MPGYHSIHWFDGRNKLALRADFYSGRFYADRMIGYIDEHASTPYPNATEWSGSRTTTMC